MPAGCACGVVCDAILITVSIGAWFGGGGINAITLTSLRGFQPHTMIVLQYVYRCFRKLDRQLWDIIYCTCAEYYVESS